MATLLRRSGSTAIPSYTSSSTSVKQSSVTISTGVTNSVSSNSSLLTPTNSPSATSEISRETTRLIIIGTTIGGAFCFSLVVLGWILRRRHRLRCHRRHSGVEPPDLAEELEGTIPTPFIVSPRKRTLPSASPPQSSTTIRFPNPLFTRRSDSSINTPLTTPAEAHTRRRMRSRSTRRRERERRPSISFLSFTDTTISSSTLDEVVEEIKTSAPYRSEKRDLEVERQLQPLRFGEEGSPSTSTSQNDSGLRRERTVKHTDSGWRSAAVVSLQVERETSSVINVPPDYTLD